MVERVWHRRTGHTVTDALLGLNWEEWEVNKFLGVISFVDGLAIDNNVNLKFKDAAGIAQDIMILSSGNVLRLRNPVGSIMIEPATGSPYVLPAVDNRYDLGTSGLRWRDGRFSRNVYAELFFSNQGALPNAALTATGEVRTDPEAATSTQTTKNSPPLKLRGKYWDGTVSVNRDATILHNIIDTAPTSQILFQIAGTDKLAIHQSEINFKTLPITNVGTVDGVDVSDLFTLLFPVIITDRPTSTTLSTTWTLLDEVETCIAVGEAGVPKDGYALTCIEVTTVSVGVRIQIICPDGTVIYGTAHTTTGVKYEKLPIDKAQLVNGVYSVQLYGRSDGVTASGGRLRGNHIVVRYD